MLDFNDTYNIRSGSTESDFASIMHKKRLESECNAYIKFAEQLQNVCGV